MFENTVNLRISQVNKLVINKSEIQIAYQLLSQKKSARQK